MFARSTKEGNYYMVPMFFVVLPLAYWSMARGTSWTAVTSWVPVANALLAAAAADGGADRPVPVAARPGGGGVAGGVHRRWRCGRRSGSSTAKASVFREAEGGGRRGRLAAKK